MQQPLVVNLSPTGWSKKKNSTNLKEHLMQSSITQDKTLMEAVFYTSINETIVVASIYTDYHVQKRKRD